jgi:hypothetical protein
VIRTAIISQNSETILVKDRRTIQTMFGLS